MAAKEIRFNQAAREAVLRGVTILSDAMAVTLEPNGRNVVIEMSYSPHPPRPMKSKFLSVKKLLCPGLVVSMLTVATLCAGELPSFQEQAFTIKVAKTTASFRLDPSFATTEGVAYPVKGQTFGEQGVSIPAATGTTRRQTPWETLSELFAAYKTGDLDTIKRLYTADSQAKFDEKFKDDAFKKRYLTMNQTANSMNVILGFDWSNRFVALVKINNQGMPIPFLFNKSQDQWFLSIDVLKDSILQNLMAGLYGAGYAATINP